MNKETLKLVRKIHHYFKKNYLTLSIAESCTGGLISHYITALPGASIFFKLAVVSYSLEAKKKVLGISSKNISRFGVVSEEIAKEMADKIRKLTRTDYALSTTGNLGPTVLEDKEKGLIYIAISKEGRTFSKQLRLKFKREKNKELATESAIKFLLEIISG